MFNRFLKFTQSRCEYLFENSFILQRIDKMIFLLILGVFIFSAFADSDSIGFIALLTIGFTGLKLLTKKGETLKGNLFEYALLVYFLFVLMSLAGSSLFGLSLKGFFKTCIYLGFYVSVVQYLKSNNSKIYWFMLIIALCVGVESLYAVWQNSLGLEGISTWQDVSNLNPEEVMTRVYGTLKPYNPNLFAGYLLCALPCVMGVTVLEYLKKGKGLIYLALSILGVIAIFLTGCRGAYIGLISIFVVFALILAKFAWQKYKKLYLSVVASVMAFGVLFVFSFEPLRARVFSIFSVWQDSSNSFRFNVYNASWQMFKDNWLLGIGVGNQNFREIYGLYMKTGFDALSCYNVFLEIAIESGIFALIAFLGFLGILIYRSMKFIFHTNDLKPIIIVTTALVSIIAVMVHGFVDTVFFRPQIQFVFWTMVAFIRVLTDKNVNQ